MVRTRIRGDQSQDISFVSEREFNDFFADVVITGTVDETDVIQEFDNYLPGRGIFVGLDGNVVTTGTNTINITGFYNEFVLSSGTLQTEIDAIVIDQAGIGSITASGVTVTGTVVFESLDGITLIPNDITNTITFSGTSPEASSGITDINSETGPSITLVGAGDVTVSTSASNVLTISGVETLFPDEEPANAIVGAGTVVVTSGSNETVVSGTPHTVNTDTISDAIVGGVGIVVTSGSNETTIDGHLRYTKDENDAIIGGENVTVVSGVDTITISSIDTDTVSDAIVAGHGITITSGTDATLISSFDDDDVDSVTVSGVTVTGSIQFETLGGTTLSTDISDTDNPVITISGGAEVGELTGSLFQIDFTNGGNTSNTWLAVSDSNLGGNTTPWNAAFPCRLAGLSFSNRNTGVNQDLEFHIARVDDGNTSTIEFTWEIRDCRTAYKTDLPLDALVLQPGDKVSVFSANAGGSGRDVWFGAFWEITSRPSAEDCEDWSGDIS